MTMDIEIKVNAPGALSTVAAVEGALAKVEAAGPRAGAAISAGLRESSSSAERAKASTQGLTAELQRMAGTGKAFEGLTDQFKREAAALERIRGPAREYEADLKALDMLLHKNTISTREYADEV